MCKCVSSIICAPLWDYLLIDLKLFLQLYTGGSVSGAAFMNESTADICLNWAGTQTNLQSGLSRVNKACACFSNDYDADRMLLCHTRRHAPCKEG